MSSTSPPGAAEEAPVATPASADQGRAQPPHADDTARGGPPAWLGVLIVAAVSVGLFWNTLDHELVYDDYFLINPLTNSSMMPVVDDLGAVLDLFGQEYWEGVRVSGLDVFGARGQALYRPLTLAIWGTITHFQFHDRAAELATRDTSSGNQKTAEPFHRVNLAANALTCAVFFLLLLRLFGNWTLALLGALFYAVHPLHSEAVAYVAGLSDILTALTVFLGLLLWERATRTPGRLRWGSWAFLLVTLFLGLLAKESAILLLPAVALADLMLGLRGRAVALKHRVAVYAGLLGVIATNIAIRWSILGRLLPDERSLSGIDNPLITVDTGVRLVNSFKLLARYLWLTLWPQELSIDYSFNQIPVSQSLLEPAPLAGFVLIVALLVVGLVRLRSWPAFGFGVLLFLGTAAFFSNMLAAIGTIFAERLTYLPTAGVALAAAAVLVRLFGAKRPGAAALHPVGLLIALVMLGALGMRTVDRNKEFRSAVVLFEAAAETAPHSTRVHFQLGSIYETQQLYDKALEEVQTALRIAPNFFQARIKIAEIFAAAGKTELAIPAYRDVIGGLGLTNPDGSSNAEVLAMLNQGLARALQATGDLEGAREALQNARELGGVGTGETDVAMVALLQGQQRWAESLSVIEDGLIEHPESVRLLLAKARAASQLRDAATYEAALEGLDQTAEGRQLADMMRATVQYDRAADELDDAALEDAVATFERIAEERPDFPTPYVFKGRYLLDIAGDAEAAIAEFDRALALSPLDPEALKFKALAQIQLGKHAAALQTLEVLGTVNPDVDYHVLLAEVHYILGNVEEVAAAYEAAQELLPEGASLAETILTRSLAAQQAGDDEDALRILDQALLQPRYADNVRLLVARGDLLLDMARFDEALASFDMAEAAFAAQPELVYDEYLPIRRARCLMMLDRDLEAAQALERAEARIASLDAEPVFLDRLRVSWLQRSAQLHLRPGGTFHDLDHVQDLCAQGLAITSGRFPPFFDLSIDAFLQAGNLSAAAGRARQAESSFEGLPHEKIYGLAAQALERAAAGDTEAAVGLLEGSQIPLHLQIRVHLQG